MRALPRAGSQDLAASCLTMAHHLWLEAGHHHVTISRVIVHERRSSLRADPLHGPFFVVAGTRPDLAEWSWVTDLRDPYGLSLTRIKAFVYAATDLSEEDLRDDVRCERLMRAVTGPDNPLQGLAMEVTGSEKTTRMGNAYIALTWKLALSPRRTQADRTASRFRVGNVWYVEDVCGACGKPPPAPYGHNLQYDPYVLRGHGHTPAMYDPLGACCRCETFTLRLARHEDCAQYLMIARECERCRPWAPDGSLA